MRCSGEVQKRQPSKPLNECITSNGKNTTDTSVSSVSIDSKIPFVSPQREHNSVFMRVCRESQYDTKQTTSANLWICKHCNASFDTREAVRSHFRKEHHSMHQFKCAICQYSDDVPLVVIEHLKKIHNINDSKKLQSNYYRK